MSGTFRRLQTGYVRSYALAVLGGAVIVVVAVYATVGTRMRRRSRA